MLQGNYPVLCAKIKTFRAAMKKWGILWVIIASTVFYFTRCTYDHLANQVVPKKDTTTIKIIDTTKKILTDTTKIHSFIPCNPDTVYFTNVILPLLTSNCGLPGCHNSTSRAKGIDLTNYSGVRSTVTPGNLNGSELYTHTQGIKSIMPPSGKLSKTDLDTITQWILQGAKNNSCTAGNGQCDSTNVSFASTIVPIINTYCRGCHNSALQSGGVELDTYNGLLLVAQTGQLMGGLTGVLPQMPQTGAKLSNCYIGTIRQWIKEGAKNN